jgi:hypothetical protein
MTDPRIERIATTAVDGWCDKVLTRFLAKVHALGGQAAQV